MAVLKTGNRSSFADGVAAGQCPVCEGAIKWQVRGVLGGELLGSCEHQALPQHERGAPLAFSAIVEVVRLNVMDHHGNALVERETAEGIALVPDPGDRDAARPSPGPRRAVIKYDGSDTLDLGTGAGIPRPGGSPS